MDDQNVLDEKGYFFYFNMSQLNLKTNSGTDTRSARGPVCRVVPNIHTTFKKERSFRKLWNASKTTSPFISFDKAGF